MNNFFKSPAVSVVRQCRKGRFNVNYNLLFMYYKMMSLCADMRFFREHSRACVACVRKFVKWKSHSVRTRRKYMYCLRAEESVPRFAFKVRLDYTGTSTTWFEWRLRQNLYLWAQWSYDEREIIKSFLGSNGAWCEFLNWLSSFFRYYSQTVKGHHLSSIPSV